MHVLPRKWREGWRQHARNQAAWPPAITPCASAATNYSAARLVATLLRALRADKLYLAALSATLLHYLRDEALSKIPVCRMISMPKAEIAKKALAAELREGGFDASVIDGQSTVGGGSLPGETLPTKLVAVRHRSPKAQAARLRSQSIVARVQEGQLLLDPRTVGDWSKLMQNGAEALTNLRSAQ